MTAYAQAGAGAHFRQAPVDESPWQAIDTVNAKLDALFAQHRS